MVSIPPFHTGKLLEKTTRGGIMPPTRGPFVQNKGPAHSKSCPIG